MLGASGYIGKDFFIKELNGGAVQISSHFGQKQIEEVGEERGQEFFKQAVMVHARSLVEQAIGASVNPAATAAWNGRWRDLSACRRELGDYHHFRTSLYEPDNHLPRLRR